MAEGSTLDLPLNISHCREVLETNKAVIANDVEKLKQLVASGANIDESDCFGYRPIDYAKSYQLEEILQFIHTKIRKSPKGDRDFPGGRWDDSVNFNRAAPKIDYGKTKKIAIAVYDKRPYIVGKEKMPNYIGYSRHSSLGPRDLITRDRKPFAQTLSLLIAEGYREADCNVVDIRHGINQDTQNSLGVVSQNMQDRVLTLKLNELITETLYMVGSTDVKYDIDLSIADEKGKELFSRKFAGTEMIAINGYAPSERAIIIAPEVLYYVLTDMLNKPEVKAALL
jgi:hypothetical protein